MADTFKQEVYDALLAVVETGAFPTVTYTNPTGGQLFPRMVVDDMDLAVPKQFEANEIAFTMIDGKEKMEADRKRVIQTVRWEVHIGFNEQVAPERFLEAFSRTVPATAEHRQFDLVLVDAEVSHPPRREPSHGTFLILTVEAQPTPVRTV